MAIYEASRGQRGKCIFFSEVELTAVPCSWGHNLEDKQDIYRTQPVLLPTGGCKYHFGGQANSLEAKGDIITYLHCAPSKKCGSVFLVLL